MEEGQATIKIGQQTAGRDIYNAEVINLLVKTVESFSADYSSRIQAFLKHYLGTEDMPMPFGGRYDVLQKLDNWLDDPEEPPYMLLAAPAGQGKSALLVRWTQTLLAKKDLTVIFIPISIRFRTNLESFVFFALTAGLAAFYHDDMPYPDLSPGILRDKVLSYLSRQLPEGRRLLIVLDGVDEAAGWEIGSDLFANYYSNNIRVVVSARYLANDADASSWMGRLGWDQSDLACSIDLQPLDQKGVADVLLRMGQPLAGFAQRMDIVSQIYQLSQGDPLLVQLYIEDLWSKRKDSARLRPEDLAALKPGLKAYLARWWNEQCKRWESQNKDRGGKKPTSEPMVKEVLNIFSCALGPLSRNDILSIVSPNFEMDDCLLKDALDSLDRIIIGDGINQDYIFSHPRFGSYFYDDLSPIGRKKFDSRFISYGGNNLKSLNQGTTSPKDVSGYIVQYYGAHLERANCGADKILSLVSNGWRKAWEVQESAYSGFLSDVGRAWKAAEAADKKEIEIGNKANHLSGSIRCALCLASINSLSANIPTELLIQLVKNKICNHAQALAYARQNSSLESRAEALRELSSQFDDPPKTEILREALSVAREIQNQYTRATVLAVIASDLSDPMKKNIMTEALSVARDISYEDDPDYEIYEVYVDYDRANALAAIASNLSDPREALAVAREIQDEDSRADALATIAPNLSDLQEALTVAREIHDEYSRADSLAAIASNLSDPQKKDILLEALAVAREIHDEYSKADALAVVASNLSDPLKKDILLEALAVAREIQNGYSRADALAVVASNLPDPLKKDILLEALAAAREIHDEYSRADALAAIASTLPDPLKRDILLKALTVAREVHDEDFRADALVEIALNLPDPLKKDILTEALAVARKIQDGAFRANALAVVASNLSDPLKKDILLEALAVARGIHDEYSRGDALAAIASNLSVPQEALAVAREIHDEITRAGALAAIASNLSDPLKKDILLEALAVSREIQGEYFRADALVAIAPSLSDPLKKDVLKEALDAVYESESGEQLRAIQLAAIAPNFSDPTKTNILNWALSIVKGDQYEYSEVSGLARIACKLSNPLKKDILLEALAVARKIQDVRTRADALVIIAPLLKEFSNSDVTLYSLWLEYSRNLARHTRSDLLSDLTELLPIIAVLGGSKTMGEIAHDIEEVGRWWP